MRASVVALLLAMPSLALAQGTPPAPAPASGPVTYGAGHKLCSDWLAAETKPDQGEALANRFWVAGVMSAYNIYVAAPGFDIGKGQAPADMKGYMHAKCAEDSTATIASAATAYIAMLKTKQAH